MGQLQGATLRVRAVERALELLLRIAEQPGRGLVELANEAGVSKSTAHRLLVTLEHLKVVERPDGSRLYHLGPRLRALLHQTDAHVDLRVVALPEMQLLRELSQETVSLHVRRGNTHVPVEQIESDQEIRRVQVMGRPIPLATGATAKAILAFLPPTEAHAIVAANQTGNELGPSDEELSNIRQMGYALSVGERIPGACAIAAPILDRAGEVLGAVAIAGPLFRFSPAHALVHAPDVKRAVGRIQVALG